MEQIMSSPMPWHARRAVSSCQKDPGRETQRPGITDARWSLLDLVRRCRDRLALRDRDLAVLRGLLSLVPASAAPGTLVVFASNRVLVERCDGIDERTLRRRLAHLDACGLLSRRPSPNRKRYQVRDDLGDVRLTYGIDLSPLFALRDHLAALADQCMQDEIRRKALRAVIRDILYHHAASMDPDLAVHAQRSLRRALSADQLQDLIDTMHGDLRTTTVPNASGTADVSVSNGQNDRHIQSSDKEDFESEHAGENCDDPDLNPQAKAHRDADQNDITVHECMSLAKNAAAFASSATRDWLDVVKLSTVLAPAIGLRPEDVESARQTMGPLGCALAVLGLVEAFGKIRNTRAYLHALTQRARNEGIDLVRMFRSLTKPQIVGPAHGHAV